MTMASDSSSLALNEPNASSKSGTTGNVQVEIFDGSSLLGTVMADSQGIWTITASRLAVSAHSFTAKSAGLTSAARTLSVTAPTPELVFDESPASLQTKLYKIGNTLPPFPAGSTLTRQATGGKPPYTYTSSAPAVANVSAAGLVTPNGNGSSVISVSDAAGQTKRFTVTVSNILTVTFFTGVNHNAASVYQPAGHHLPSRAELTAIYQQHSARWPIDTAFYWSTEKNPPLDYYWGRSFPGGAESTRLGATANHALSIPN